MEPYIRSPVCFNCMHWDGFMKYHLDDQIKEKEMGRTYSKCGGCEKSTEQFFFQKYVE